MKHELAERTNNCAWSGYSALLYWS